MEALTQLAQVHIVSELGFKPKSYVCKPHHLLNRPIYLFNFFFRKRFKPTENIQQYSERVYTFHWDSPVVTGLHFAVSLSNAYC